MSDIQEKEVETEMKTETVEASESLKAAFGPAVITLLKTYLYFVILPYKIWKTTTIRLARSSTNGGAIVRDGEQFPVYTFYRTSLDATIFLMGLLSVPLAFVGIGFIIYIVILPLLSFFNEMLSMSLISTQSLVKIEESTKK